jgi:alkylhydroperoxidase/carboxymuconolactone decarboxylase family protein YurZ
MAGTVTVIWLIAATLTPARNSEARQPEKSQGGTMQSTQPNIQGRRLSPEDVRTVAPALEAYTQERLYGDVWKRPDLTPRDRSLITLAALIARGQAPALIYYLDQAIAIEQHGDGRTS